MSWHYQLIKYEGGVGLHEVYKGDGGYSHTEEPALFADSKDDMLELLRIIESDIKKYDVLDWEKLHE